MTEICFSGVFFSFIVGMFFGFCIWILMGGLLNRPVNSKLLMAAGAATALYMVYQGATCQM